MTAPVEQVAVADRAVTGDGRPGREQGRQRLRTRSPAARSPAPGAEDLAAAGVDAGHVAPRRRLAQRVERRDAADGHAEREPERARRREADAQARERPRPCAGDDQLDVGRRHAGAAQQAVHVVEHALGPTERPVVADSASTSTVRAHAGSRRRRSRYQTRGSPIACEQLRVVASKLDQPSIALPTRIRDGEPRRLAARPRRPRATRRSRSASSKYGSRSAASSTVTPAER